MLDHVVGREQAAHGHLRRGDPPKADAFGPGRPVDAARTDPADPQVSDRLLGGEPSPCQELHEPERLEAVDAEPVRQLGAGEHAAVQARQRDPLGAATRQSERLQRPLASLQMVDQRDRRSSGDLRYMRVPARALGWTPWWVSVPGDGVTASRNRENALGGVKPRPGAIRPEPADVVPDTERPPAIVPPSLPVETKVFGCGSSSQRRGCRTGQKAFVQRDWVARIVQSINRKESNDGTHETKSALVRRWRVGPEQGEDLPRPENRQLPD